MSHGRHGQRNDLSLDCRPHEFLVAFHVSPWEVQQPQTVLNAFHEHLIHLSRVDAQTDEMHFTSISCDR